MITEHLNDIFEYYGFKSSYFFNDLKTTKKLEEYARELKFDNEILEEAIDPFIISLKSFLSNLEYNLVLSDQGDSVDFYMDLSDFIMNIWENLFSFEKDQRVISESYISHFKEKDILELGPGSGVYFYKYLEICKHIYLSEKNPIKRSFIYFLASEKRLSHKITFCSLESAFKYNYDVIIAINFFDHIKAPALLLKNLANSMKDEKLLIFCADFIDDDSHDVSEEMRSEFFDVLLRLFFVDSSSPKGSGIEVRRLKSFGKEYKLSVNIDLQEISFEDTVMLFNKKFYSSKTLLNKDIYSFIKNSLPATPSSFYESLRKLSYLSEVDIKTFEKQLLDSGVLVHVE